MKIEIDYINFMCLLDNFSDNTCPLEDNSGLCNCKAFKGRKFEICCSDEIYNYLKNNNILTEGNNDSN